MQKSQRSPSSAKQSRQSRGKLVLALGILSLFLIPGDIILSSILIILFPRSFSYKFDELFAPIHGLILLLVPIFGISAWLMANKELRKIRDGIVSPTARGVTRRGKFLGISGLVVFPFVIFAVLYSIFPARSVQSYKEAVISDLANLSGHAYQYRIRSLEGGGGGGSYEGYKIPQTLAENENGIYTVAAVYRDSVILHGRAKQVDGTVEVKVDPDGKPNTTSWTYGGDFR